MTINHKHNCKSCNETLKEIGDPVHITGGKEGDTDHSFFQCSKCGSIWVKVKDSGGLGGNGTFFHSLTKSFY